MLTLAWFLTNNACCFIFHAGNLAAGTPISLADFPRFFDTWEAGCEAAAARGLTVNPLNGRTTASYDVSATANAQK